ncbi:MAG: sugar phosphate isomerase/epimerase [Pseudomonadota bacterium]
MPQSLEVFQSLWAMDLRRPDGFEWPLKQKFEMIAEAGFDGVDIVFGDYSLEDIAPLLTQYDLAATITAFPPSVDALRAAIDMAQAVNARHLNIIGKVYPLSVTEGAQYVRGWLGLTDAAGVDCTIETHRDCLTTDMLYTLQLLDAVPEMTLCADLSHFVVGREFSWPITDIVQDQVDTILDRSQAFQGRIASREQIQIQFGFAQHAEWLTLFLDWWRRGMLSWRKRNSADARLNFLCELGPREYAITGADGYELSDRWQEAQMLTSLVRELWSDLDR